MTGQQVSSLGDPRGKRREWRVLLVRALLVVGLFAIAGGLLLLAAPQAHADPQEECRGVEVALGVGGYRCRIDGGFEGIVYIRGQEPGGSSPDSPGFHGPAQPITIDCSSVGTLTLGNYGLYNYCHGTDFRPGPSGLLWDCSDPFVPIPVSLDPSVLDDYAAACLSQDTPPSPPQEQPDQSCYAQARNALRLPRPQIEVNPDMGLTGLTSYFWIANYRDDMQLSRSFSVSCSIGEWRAVSAHLNAWVVRYRWDFGDGWGMTSTTPGAPWPEWLSEIYHVYERSSLQQPDQKYLVRVWAFWQGSFTLDAERLRCTTREDGSQQCWTERRTFGPYDLGETYIVGRLRYPVQQAQSVIVDPSVQQ